MWFVCLLLFSAGLCADGIEIVYHIATLNNWKEIAEDQLDTLQSSGLWEACDGLSVTVVGEQISEVQDLFRELTPREKLNIVHASNDLHQYEFPGMEMAQQIAAKRPAAKILYMHTKGLLHYRQPTEHNVHLWRKYMEYFTMERWRDCVNALESADMCGVDYSRSPSGPYFSGNFWWARGSYIATCKLSRDSRYSCEQFVGTGDRPIAKSLHQSGDNPKATFPRYYHAPPGQEYFQGIMNLYLFGYLPEFYRQDDERVVSCEIVGGLGNQLFQIANALAVAWDNGYTPIFPKITESPSYLYPRPVYWDSVFHKISTYAPKEDLHLVQQHEESLFSYKKIVPVHSRIQLCGHFPSAKYFDHHRDKILEIFRLPPAMEAIVDARYQEIITSENEHTVSIHIRLDDTFIAPIPGVIDFWKEPYDSYYDEAIALFPGDVTFVVFSDDCAWSREYMKDKLRGRRAVYTCDKDYLDINLMARCQHNILINSTYSWWGAYLNRNPKKKVVSPKYWQARGNTPYRPDILMPEWTLIENVY